jgi:hypothetical protein
MRTADGVADAECACLLYNNKAQRYKTPDVNLERGDNFVYCGAEALV